MRPSRRRGRPSSRARRRWRGSGRPGRPSSPRRPRPRRRRRTGPPRCGPRRSRRRDRAARRRRRRSSRRQTIPGAASTTSAVTLVAAVEREPLRARRRVIELPTTPRWRMSSAPKRSAWRPASRASSAPPMPSGKPKKFSISEVCDAWPPGHVALEQRASRARRRRRTRRRRGRRDRRRRSPGRSASRDGGAESRHASASDATVTRGDARRRRRSATGGSAPALRGRASSASASGDPGLVPLVRLGDAGQEVAQAVGSGSSRVPTRWTVGRTGLIRSDRDHSSAASARIPPCRFAGPSGRNDGATRRPSGEAPPR